MTNAASHPLTRLVAVALALTAGLYWLFFLFSERIWAIRDDVPLEQITPWARWAMYDRDGSEPQVLLLLTVSLLILTGGVMYLLERHPVRWSGTLVALCFGIALIFATQAIPIPPDLGPASTWAGMLAAEVGVFLLAAFVCRAARSRSGYILLALLLVPVCFLAATQPLYDDLSCVLAPALRLRHGFAISEIYFQYDYLPSLMAVLWNRLGGDPAAFPLCTGAFYYLLLAGCFLISRRMFHQERLAALLLVTLIVVRVYAIRPDANASPQVTPIRLDLWIYLLGLALAFGLRHWSVGLAAGLIYFFARTFGLLYLAGYGLALSVDFLARRAAASDPPPFWRDVIRSLKEIAPSLTLAAGGFIAGTIVFGGVVSDAVSGYRHLGLGMMRISSFSSFWWVLPFLAIASWLAFSQYVPSDKRSAAALFAVALAVSNSIYFFGRSHEHNLLNISASLLFCIFLCIDRMAAVGGSPTWAQKVVPALPWVILAVVALAYSGRLVPKVQTQAMTIFRGTPPPPSDDAGPINCGEISTAAKDSKVFLYSAYGYWFDERCGYVPYGYVQPFVLEHVQSKAVTELETLLDSGYKIVIPKARPWKSIPGQYSYNQFDFTEMEASLAGMEHSETEHYTLYWRPH